MLPFMHVSTSGWEIEIMRAMQIAALGTGVRNTSVSLSWRLPILYSFNSFSKLQIQSCLLNVTSFLISSKKRKSLKISSFSVKHRFPKLTPSSPSLKVNHFAVILACLYFSSYLFVLFVIMNSSLLVE